MPIILAYTLLTIDYQSPIYGLANPPHLHILDPIQNSTIWLATGAFRTSPLLSSGAETHIPLFVIVDSNTWSICSPSFSKIRTYLPTTVSSLYRHTTLVSFALFLHNPYKVHSGSTF